MTTTSSLLRDDEVTVSSASRADVTSVRVARLRTAVVALAVTVVVLIGATAVLGGLLGRALSTLPSASPFASRAQMTLAPAAGAPAYMTGTSRLTYDMDEGWATLDTYDAANTHQATVYFDYNTRQATVQTAGGVCAAVATPSGLALPDLRALRLHEIGTVVVNGATCTLFEAGRFDGSVFEVAIDLATHRICSVSVDGLNNLVVSNVLSGWAVIRPPRPNCQNHKSAEVAEGEVELGERVSAVARWGGCSTCQDVAAGVLSMLGGAGCAIFSGGLAASICGAAIASGCAAAGCGQFLCQQIGWC